MAGVSEYISKVTKQQMKELLIQYQNNMQQKGNPGYYMGKLNEDGTKATLVDGTTVDIITKGLPGSYAPVYLIGGGKGLVDQEEPYTESIDQDIPGAIILVYSYLDAYQPEIIPLFGSEPLTTPPTLRPTQPCILSTKTKSLFALPIELLDSNLSPDDLVLEEIRHRAYAPIPLDNSGCNTDTYLLYSYLGALNEDGTKVLIAKVSQYMINGYGIARSVQNQSSSPIEISWAVLSGLDFSTSTNLYKTIDGIRVPTIGYSRIESSGISTITDSMLVSKIGEYFKSDYTGVTNGYINVDGVVEYNFLTPNTGNYNVNFSGCTVSLDGSTPRFNLELKIFVYTAYASVEFREEYQDGYYFFIFDLSSGGLIGDTITTKNYQKQVISPTQIFERYIYYFISRFESLLTDESLFSALFLQVGCSFIDLTDESYLIGYTGRSVQNFLGMGSRQFIVNKQTGEVSKFKSSVYGTGALFTEDALFTNINYLPQIPVLSRVDLPLNSQRANIYLSWSRSKQMYQGIGALTIAGSSVSAGLSVVSNATNFSFYRFKVPPNQLSQDFPDFTLDSFSKRSAQINYRSPLEAYYFSNIVNDDEVLVTLGDFVYPDCNINISPSPITFGRDEFNNIVPNQVVLL
jgi:hypothetical protein